MSNVELRGARLPHTLVDDSTRLKVHNVLIVGLSLRSLPSVGKQVIDASTFNRPVQIESRAKRAFRRSYRHVSFGIAAAFPRDAFARQFVRGLGGRSRLEASRQRKSQSWLQRTLRLALIAAEKHEQRASQDKDKQEAIYGTSKIYQTCGSKRCWFLSIAVHDCRRTRYPLGSQRPGHWVLHGFVAGCKSDAKMGRHTALKVKRSVILLLFAIVASATLSARIRSPQPRKQCPGQYHAVTACRRRASGVRAVANYSRCGLARTEGAAATLRFFVLRIEEE